MDDERLNEIERRAEAATAGPWKTRHDRVAIGVGQCGVADVVIAGPEYSKRWTVGHQQVTRPVKTEPLPGRCVCTIGIGSFTEPVPNPDAEFVARSREDVPALVAEVKRLRSIVASLMPGDEGHE